MNINIRRFDMDHFIVAPVTYRDYPHQTTSIGVEIGEKVREELSQLLAGFLKFHGREEKGTFIRVDAFLSDVGLKLIELNVELADGWGVSLNLARACGKLVKLPTGTELPQRYVAYKDDYLPEYGLAISEFGMLGHDSMSIEEAFWVSERKDLLDSKLCLEQFARTWKGEIVQVPRLYSVETTPWDSLPEDVVFKFTEKYGPEALRARYGVALRKKIGKGKHVRRSYNDSRAVAQERIVPYALLDGSVTQAIIMCSGSTPITGYLQVAPSGEFIINDRTGIKGPLIFV